MPSLNNPESLSGGEGALDTPQLQKNGNKQKELARIAASKQSGYDEEKKNTRQVRFQATKSSSFASAKSSFDDENVPPRSHLALAHDSQSQKSFKVNDGGAGDGKDLKSKEEATSGMDKKTRNGSSFAQMYTEQANGYQGDTEDAVYISLADEGVPSDDLGMRRRQPTGKPRSRESEEKEGRRHRKGEKMSKLGKWRVKMKKEHRGLYGCLNITRRTCICLLLLMLILVVPLTIAGFFITRFLNNTVFIAEKAAEVIEKPAVQSAVTISVSNNVIDRLSRVSITVPVPSSTSLAAQNVSNLPSVETLSVTTKTIDFSSPMVTGNITKAVGIIVATPEFAAVWKASIMALYDTMIDVLKNTTPASDASRLDKATQYRSNSTSGIVDIYLNLTDIATLVYREAIKAAQKAVQELSSVKDRITDGNRALYQPFHPSLSGDDLEVDAEEWEHRRLQNSPTLPPENSTITLIVPVLESSTLYSLSIYYQRILDLAIFLWFLLVILMLLLLCLSSSSRRFRSMRISAYALILGSGFIGIILSFVALYVDRYVDNHFQVLPPASSSNPTDASSSSSLPESLLNSTSSSSSAIGEIAVGTNVTVVVASASSAKGFAKEILKTLTYPAVRLTAVIIGFAIFYATIAYVIFLAVLSFCSQSARRSLVNIYRRCCCCWCCCKKTSSNATTNNGKAKRNQKARKVEEDANGQNEAGSVTLMNGEVTTQDKRQDFGGDQELREVEEGTLDDESEGGESESSSDSEEIPVPQWKIREKRRDFIFLSLLPEAAVLVLCVGFVVLVIIVPAPIVVTIVILAICVLVSLLLLLISGIAWIVKDVKDKRRKKEHRRRELEEERTKNKEEEGNLATEEDNKDQSSTSKQGLDDSSGAQQPGVIMKTFEKPSKKTKKEESEGIVIALNADNNHNEGYREMGKADDALPGYL